MIKIQKKQIDSMLYNAKLKTVSDAFNPDDEIAVSVFCLTYNQEEYIKDALDSFLRQLVDFNVEILVHDDASTDSTPLILEKYAKKYPHIIKVFTEKENIYSKTGDTIEVEKRHIKNARGQFVASCEGDDYWSDPHKLYIQKHFMDLYTSCNFCAHKVYKIDLLDTKNNCFIPEKKVKSSVLSEREFADLVNCGYPFQTSSYFMRKYFYEMFLEEYPLFAQTIPTSDESVMYYFSNKGGAIYIDRVMSCWRQFTENSWNYNLLRSSSSDQNKRRRRLANGIMEFYEYSGKRFKSCIERANRFMIITYCSEGNLVALFSNKSIKRTLIKQGLIKYIKLRIKAFLQSKYEKTF